MKITQPILRIFTTLFFSVLLATSCALPAASDNSSTSGDNKFTVTFNGNGGTLISGKEIQIVEDAFEIVAPLYEKSGYNFDGWDKDLGAISTDTTVNAQWLEKSNDTSLSITGFTQDGNQFSLKANNNISIFSYLDKVTVASKSSWRLFSDIEGKNEIITKTVSLQIGNNVNYILVTCENDSSVIYITTIKRLDMFTVIFNTDGGTAIPSQQVQEESLIQEVSDPQKTGHTFAGWDYDFSEPVISNMTVNAIWSINKYTITWKNYDGTTLEVDNAVAYGTTPSYDGSTPNKPSDGEYFYTFSGWSPAVTSVSGNQTYTAQFNEVEKGGIYQFGSYPQTKVTDSSLISTLTTTAGTLPTSANAQAWTSYGYYISSSAATSYMWYIDLVNGSDEYRGVYFTSYRPYSTSSTSSPADSYQDDNGYTTSNVYWFKYEPITWRVLDMQAGKAFLMANLVLDSQDYHYSTSTRTIGGVTVYSNNYKESHIRSWLNDNFYNTAFSTEEKARIQTTTVDNSVTSTGYNPNKYASANTSDKVFLLSYAEATSATYGLSTATSRQLAPSAYAKAQGVYTSTNGFNFWWLRSPYNDYAYYARDVRLGGNVDYSNTVSYAGCGVVPALWISL